jgi:deazaflavin-dependent oxidoreductase (nitroreductase family)
MNDFTQTLITELRNHDGKVTQGPMAGTPLLILTTTGARTGEPRTTVVDHSRDGDSWVVAASKGGAPTNPAWYHNLVAHPRVTVEVDGERFEAVARVATGAERDRLWKRHVEAIPLFGDYPARTTRVIPMVVIDRAR